VRNVKREAPAVRESGHENSSRGGGLEPSQGGMGPHQVKIVLVKRDPRIGVPVVVNNVEFWVTYE
ncbi:MAG: hypothetical protein OXD46_01180, partial [Chloroflexi bacterium]|nr:hypothetical protein [Chloroflexota bacterium]